MKGRRIFEIRNGYIVNVNNREYPKRVILSNLVKRGRRKIGRRNRLLWDRYCRGEIFVKRFHDYGYC